MLNEVITLCVEKFRDKKKVTADPETVNLLLKKVFSKYRFPVNDPVKIEQLDDFVHHLDSNGYRGHLAPLYEQAQIVINLKPETPRQKNEYKNFAKQYAATNRELCTLIGLKLPDGPQIFDEPFMVSIAIFLGFLFLFCASSVVLFALASRPYSPWILLIENVLITPLVVVSLLGTLVGVLFMILTGGQEAIPYVKYFISKFFRK